MRSGTPGTVFIFYKCQSEGNCDFSTISKEVENLISGLKKRKIEDVDDACEKHPDCVSCIADRSNKCGWCSTNVIYKNGSIIGKQCAGHNEDGSKDPFICNGIYSTVTCEFVTTTTTDTTSTSSTGKPTSSTSTSTSTTGEGKKKFECLLNNATCESTTSGTFDFKVDCEQQCQKTPFVPIDLVGNWRGLQINKNYIVGEWKAVFTQTNVTVTRPDGDKFSAGVTLISNYLTLDIAEGNLKGKQIQTLWNLAFGPETKLFTWAWGVPGGKPPKDFASSMTEENNAEFVFTSCLTNKDAKVCSFDH